MNIYLTLDNLIYSATGPRRPTDIPVPMPPGSLAEYAFNRDTCEWYALDVPEPEEPRDLTIGEAEQLYAEAQNGSMAAQLLIRWEDL